MGEQSLASEQALLDVELGIKEPLAIAPSYLAFGFTHWKRETEIGMQLQGINVAFPETQLDPLQ